MSLIEVNKAVQDSNTLRLRLLDLLEKESEPLIVKISALSGLYAQIFSEYCVESGKCPEIATDKIFSSLKSDIIRVVNMASSIDLA